MSEPLRKTDDPARDLTVAEHVRVNAGALPPELDEAARRASRAALARLSSARRDDGRKG